MEKSNGKSARVDSSTWTFLTNHTHVLLCISQECGSRMRDIAEQVGITERAVQRIVAELEEAGYLRKVRDGRRNQYVIRSNLRLRHRLEGHCRISELVGLILGSRMKGKSE